MQKSVLIVEDEFFVGVSLHHMLEDHGWRIMGPATSIEVALMLLEAELPTVALLDVNIAGEAVTPVAEKLRARNVPFALSTAYDNPEVFGEALAGAPNVGKPTLERLVLAALADLTGGDSRGG